VTWLGIGRQRKIATLYQVPRLLPSYGRSKREVSLSSG
jgi:hypothetical protein